MKTLKAIIVIGCITLFQVIGFSQITSTVNKRVVALLDLTVKNSETSDAEIYSAKYILKTAGIPFIVTGNVDVAKNYGMVLAASKFDVTTFTTAEKDTLISYVNRGGVLVAPNVRDSYMFPLFGISAHLNSNSRYLVKFKMFLNDPSFKWLNDTMEQTISLGKTTYTSVISSRSYTLAGALGLAVFDDNSTAITKRNYGLGTTYALGFSFKNLILTNQLNLDYSANRFYSNGFEPTSDAMMLFIKGIYLDHAPRAVWLHTSPYDSKTSLMITHDIDATSSYDTMHYYSDYENSIGLKASYFFTTHYIDDALLAAFYNLNTIPKVQDVLNKGHIAGSHSVGHFPDFDDESVFPLGMLGNTSSSYLPYNFGSGSTTAGSVLGETEVSKNLLEANFGIVIKTFRAGYLCFHDQIINALDTTGYTNSTTLSAADILNNFPFQQRKNRSTSGALTNVWEYPMTISDVFTSNPITPTNYPQKVATWLDVINRNMANNAPNVLLIHPTRLYKLTAEQDLVNGLPPGVFVTNLDLFANYWKARNAISFTSKISNDSLTVIVPSAFLPLNQMISFVVDKGQLLASIKAEDEFGNPITVIKSNFNTNDVILHFENYPALGIKTNTFQKENSTFINCYPNPANTKCTFDFRLEKTAKVKLELIDMLGNNTNTLLDKSLEEGWQSVPFNTSFLSTGIYFYKLTVNGVSVTKKMIISR
ncbi:MAG: T9SS type A sorting domain-containing protein [Bacteroidetes bacterium]|nr:T9SS type A sorting domain-containing protein [Bacteroidota bacterium]